MYVEHRHLCTMAVWLPHHADGGQFPDDFLKDNKRIPPEVYVLDGKDARQKCGAVVLSSGTTGSPKAVMLSHHNLIAICEMLRYHNEDNWRGSMREIFFPVRMNISFIPLSNLD